MTNLATDPQRVYVGATQAVAVYLGATRVASKVTNLLTNPSCEATSGTVTVRTNLATTPGRFASFGVAGGTVTNTRVPDPRWKSGNPSKVVWTVASTGIAYGLLLAGMQTAVGVVYTISVRCALTGAGVSIGDIQCGGGQPPVTTYGATVRTDQGDGTVIVSRTFTVTGLGSGTGLVDWIIVLSSGAPIGTVFMGGDVLVEAVPVLLPYFDGTTNSAPDPDLTTAWTGTANASTSVLRGVGVTGMGGGGNRAVISSSQWADNGAKALRLIPNGPGQDAYGATTYGFVAGDGGKTFLALGTARLSSAQMGSVSGQARRIIVRDDTAQTVVAQGPQAPNVAGVTPLRFQFTLPVTANLLTLRCIGGASVGNGDVWWDDLALFDVTGLTQAQIDAIGWFDGDTPRAEWTGMHDASTSTLWVAG